MKYIFSLSIVCFLACNVSVVAQSVSYSKQEVGSGIALGFGKPNETYDNTLAIGLQGNYQYNLARWFSLRANLGYIYTLPSKRVMFDANGQNIGQTLSTSNMLYAGITPLIYGRLKKANLFFGATAAAGQAWLVTKFDTPNPPENIVWTKPAWGVSPVLGCSFKINSSAKKSGELEFLITQFRFNNDETYSILNTTPIVAYRVLALQVSYRFLF